MNNKDLYFGKCEWENKPFIDRFVDTINSPVRWIFGGHSFVWLNPKDSENPQFRREPQYSTPLRILGAFIMVIASPILLPFQFIMVMPTKWRSANKAMQAKVNLSEKLKATADKVEEATKGKLPKTAEEQRIEAERAAEAQRLEQERRQEEQRAAAESKKKELATNIQSLVRGNKARKEYQARQTLRTELTSALPGVLQRIEYKEMRRQFRAKDRLYWEQNLYVERSIKIFGLGGDNPAEKDMQYNGAYQNWRKFASDFLDSIPNEIDRRRFGAILGQMYKENMYKSEFDQPHNPLLLRRMVFDRFRSGYIQKIQHDINSSLEPRMAAWDHQRAVMKRSDALSAEEVSHGKEFAAQYKTTEAVVPPGLIGQTLKLEHLMSILKGANDNLITNNGSKSLSGIVLLMDKVIQGLASDIRQGGNKDGNKERQQLWLKFLETLPQTAFNASTHYALQFDLNEIRKINFETLPEEFNEQKEQGSEDLAWALYKMRMIQQIFDMWKSIKVVKAEAY